MNQMEGSNIDVFVVSKRDLNVSDETILAYPKRFLDPIFCEDGIFQKSSKYHENGFSLSYSNLDLEDICAMLGILALTYEFLYNSVLNDRKTYKSFIENVPNSIKFRDNPISDNWAVLKLETALVEPFKQVFFNFNRCYPKMFVNLYFEDLSDGFLCFFGEQFDVEALFQQPTDIHAGERWLSNHGYKLPENYSKNRIKWLTQKINAQEHLNYRVYWQNN